MRKLITKKSCLCTFLILLATICWCAAAHYATDTIRFSQTVSLKYGDNPLTVKTVEKLDPMPNITLWDEKKAQEVGDKEGDRTVSTKVIEAYGDGEAIIPVKFCQGNFPVKSDKEGCAIDKKLAQSLWGSQDVLGKTVVWNEREFYVRGVFESGSEWMLVQADPRDEKTVFKNAEISFPQENTSLLGETSWQLAEQLVKSGKLLSPIAVIKTPLAGGAVEVLLKTPPWILLIGIFIRLIKQRNKTKHPFVLLIPVLIAVILAAWFCNMFSPLPQWLIPNKWSDFSFWSRMAKDFIKALKTMTELDLTGREIGLGKNIILTLFFTYNATVLFIFGAERIRIKTPDSLVAGIALYQIGLFIIAIFFARENPLTIELYMWLILPFYLLMDFIMFKAQSVFGGESYEAKG